jgi:hypothetical protein
MILSVLRETEKKRAALRRLPIMKVKMAIHNKGPSTNE